VRVDAWGGHVRATDGFGGARSEILFKF